MLYYRCSIIESKKTYRLRHRNPLTRNGSLLTSICFELSNWKHFYISLISLIHAPFSTILKVHGNIFAYISTSCKYTILNIQYWEKIILYIILRTRPRSLVDAWSNVHQIYSFLCVAFRKKSLTDNMSTMDHEPRSVAVRHEHRSALVRRLEQLQGDLRRRREGEVAKIWGGSWNHCSTDANKKIVHVDIL